MEKDGYFEILEKGSGLMHTLGRIDTTMTFARKLPFNPIINTLIDEDGKPYTLIHEVHLL
ncbi:hypothetical protein Glove_551g10 [Diversispora epigaea]|uniref:Uncharacterized protein n=1 Tax=Diversispora epigaea TaxID=1348612 RepID=A0A397GK70_9GLOM|nr:hypothetical protein Glove_551g10 [Diversispora epigaea]